MYWQIFLLSLIVISQCHGKRRGKCDCGTFHSSSINSRIWNGNDTPNNKRYPWLGIQIRNMKMVFKFYGTWHWVTFEKLMMKIYDFF